jgi:hypothetical protein
MGSRDPELILTRTCYARTSCSQRKLMLNRYSLLQILLALQLSLPKEYYHDEGKMLLMLKRRLDISGHEG